MYNRYHRSPDEWAVACHDTGVLSKDYFDSTQVFKDEDFFREACAELVQLFADKGGARSPVVCVGVQMSASPLAEMLSEYMFKWTGEKCHWVSPEKHGNGDDTVMVFPIKDAHFMKGRSVLLCEGDLTTGDAVQRTVDAVQQCDGALLPFVLALCNSSSLEEIDGIKVISLVHR